MNFMSKYNIRRKKMNVCRILCIAIAVFMMSVGTAMAGDAGKETAAVAAAEKWLSIVDQGNYAQSWKEAAALFRSAVKQDQWEQSLQAARKPLGKMMSRRVKNKTYTTSLPGAPDGEYVVIQFDASFENKKTATETVTPMMDKDGRWRVSGYYMK